MTESLTIQGRCLSPADLQSLRQWVGENPHWSRWRLSRELATRWDWRRVGSLDVGKDATLIVTNGDPLEIMTNVEMEFIQGKNISLSSRHTRFYEKYKEKYHRLGIK